MTNPLLIRSTNDLLYSYSLSSAYRSAWVYDPDFALYKDADIWEKVRRDPVVLSSMDRRERSIVREWHTESPTGSKEKKDSLYSAVVNDALCEVTNFSQARKRLARAPILGRTYEYIEGERMMLSLGGLPDIEWWVPMRLRNVDRRRFHLVADHKRDAAGKSTMDIHMEFFSVVRNLWEPLAHPEYFVQYVHDDTEDRLHYGRGYLEAIYFYHWMKTNTLEKIGQGIDRWANGIMVGKIEGLRNGSTSKTNEDLRTGMKSLLENMRTGHIAVFEKGDEIDIKETTGSGHEISMNFVRYLDEAIERLLNGSILPAGHAGSEGSKARAETESDTSESFYQSDREALDEVITKQLIGLFVVMNRVQLAKLGLGACKPPKFESEQKRKEDPILSLDAAERIHRLGLPLGVEEIYHKGGFTKPGPDEEQLEGQTTSAIPNPFANVNANGGFDEDRATDGEDGNEQPGGNPQPPPA